MSAEEEKTHRAERQLRAAAAAESATATNNPEGGWEEGDPLEPDTLLSTALLVEMGIEPEDASAFLGQLIDKRYKRWGSLTTLESKEQAIALLEDKNIGRKIWNFVQEKKKEPAGAQAGNNGRVVSVDEAIEKVFAKIEWKNSVADFTPKLWEPSSRIPQSIARSVREAKVFGSFGDLHQPDFLLTEMLRAWPTSLQLLQYSYHNGLLEYHNDISHDTFAKYDTVVLIGTSGAGKTSISLRLAAKDYAMLFVADPKGNGGSSDVKYLAAIAESLYTTSNDADRVEKLVRGNFRALIIFRLRLLQECKSRYPDFSPLHWTMAQLYPQILFGFDVFLEFCEQRTGDDGNLVSLPSFQGVRWIVIDESQTLNSKLDGVFRSKESGGSPRSLLVPFLRVLEYAVGTTKLLCGTGLSASSIIDVTVSPIKTAAQVTVIGVATYLDPTAVEEALSGWGVPTSDEAIKRAIALFAGRPRQATYLAAEVIETGTFQGKAANDLKVLFRNALAKTHGLDPANPKRNATREAGPDLFSVLQDAALNYVLGRSGVVRSGGLFAVQHGICTLARRHNVETSTEPSQKQKVEMKREMLEIPPTKKEEGLVSARDTPMEIVTGECVIAEALVIQAFAEPLAKMFESKIVTSTDHSSVGFTVEDYLALNHGTLTNAVTSAAKHGQEIMKLSCETYLRNWQFLHEEYRVRFVERCSKEGEETLILRRWLDEKRSGVIIPVATHGADLVILNWNNDVPLVIIVQSKSGESESTPKALLALLLPYTTNRAEGMRVESMPGQQWEQVLKRCVVAYVVFKPMEGSNMRSVGLKEGRLVVILDKNSWQKFASGLQPGIDNLMKFKMSTVAIDK